MSLLGFDAVGRLALGQITKSPQDASVNLVGAAGVGVAGSMAANDGGILNPAVGVGVARAFSQKQVFSGMPSAVGAGIAGAIVGLQPRTATGVSGTGVAGSMTSNPAALMIGVAGTGVAGGILINSTAPVIVGVAGVGTVGHITPEVDKKATGVSGTGVAGKMTVMVSGGGGNGAAPGDGDRPKIKRRPLPQIAVPKKPERKGIELPPDWLRKPAPPLVPIQAPAEHIEPDTVQSMREVGRMIQQAHDASELMRQQQASDEQDMADIEALLATLD